MVGRKRARPSLSLTLSLLQTDRVQTDSALALANSHLPVYQLELSDLSTYQFTGVPLTEERGEDPRVLQRVPKTLVISSLSNGRIHG